MKVTELKKIIENIITSEVKKTIMEEATGKKEVYHIKCEGIPLATFESEEEANDALPDYKDTHKDGELIIEKGVYENHDDMMDKLDEMNDQLEETNDMENTEKQPMEGNEFSGALKAAREAGEDKFTVDGKEYDVEESWSKQMEEEEMEPCSECGGSYMEEEEEEEDNQSDMDKWNMDQMKDSVKKHFGISDDEGDDFEEMLRGRRKKHSYVDKGEEIPDEMSEEKESCEKCGKEVCECGGGMYESKKKTLRLTETELTNLIAKMVSESIPGLDAAKKSHTESGKENQEYLASVDKKMKDYLTFDGNDNPEFPKAIGKGEKVARKNTPEQEEEIAKNYAGLENLEYDIEPSEQFKKRLKMAIEGDTLMGNGKVTEPASIKPSNGAEKGKEAKEKEGNHIQTPETAKKIEKQVKDREEDKKNRVLYSKEKVPVSESKVNFSSVLEAEIKKMKNITEYNKKTQ